MKFGDKWIDVDGDIIVRLIFIFLIIIVEMISCNYLFYLFVLNSWYFGLKNF